MDPMPRCRVQFQVENEWIDTMYADHVGCAPGLVRLAGDLEQTRLYNRYRAEKRPVRIWAPGLKKSVDGWHINFSTLWEYPFLYEYEQAHQGQLRRIDEIIILRNR